LRKSSVRRFPYVVFYLDLEEYIWIAAVAHQRRRPGYWVYRTPE
jgi:toxin ParE1/3/4